MAEWIDADSYTRVRVDGNRLDVDEAAAEIPVSMPLTPDFVVALRAQLAEWLAAQTPESAGTAQDTALWPIRFAVDTNDEDYVYVEWADGRVSKLDACGSLHKHGFPFGEGVTTYTPE